MVNTSWVGPLHPGRVVRRAPLRTRENRCTWWLVELVPPPAPPTRVVPPFTQVRGPSPAVQFTATVARTSVGARLSAPTGSPVRGSQNKWGSMYVKKTLMTIGVAAAALALVPLASAGAAPGGANWTNAGGDYRNTRSQPLRVEADGRQRRRSRDEVGLHDRRRRVGDAGRRRQTVYVPDWAGNLYAVDRTTGRRCGGEDPGASGVPGRQGAGDAGDRGNKVIVGTQGAPSRRWARRQAARVRQEHRARCCGAQARQQSRRHHHAVGHRPRRPGLRGRRVAGGGARCLRPGLRVLQLPGQHAGPRREHRRDRVEDLHGARPGTPAGRSGAARRPSTPARPALHRDRQQLLGAAAGARLRGGRGQRPGGAAACMPADDHFDSILALDLEDRRHPVGDRGPAVRRLDGRLHPVLRRRRPTAPSRPVPTTTSGRRRPVHRQGRRTASRATWSAPGRRAASTGRSTPTPARSCGSPGRARRHGRRPPVGLRRRRQARLHRRTPTATSSRGPLPGERATTQRRVERHSTPPPARCCGRRAAGRRRRLRPRHDGQRRRVRLRPRPARAHVRLERGHRRRAVAVRERRLLPVRRGHLQRHGLLGLGLQQLRLRHPEQQAVRVRTPERPRRAVVTERISALGDHRSVHGTGQGDRGHGPWSAVDQARSSVSCCRSSVRSTRVTVR